MYELVNTSVENGLLAGAHGFATVAMTQGMSEALRNQLEAYCAYQHLSSANDAQYYKANPINWFHAMLPQGEHIVGRVAPCKFDYTGRTNRLARLVVLINEEWPRGKSAADVMASRVDWLEEAWSGEAHILVEDAAALQAVKTCGAAFDELENWVDLFGARGKELAQKVAWQVERNLLTGNRSIFFKTSAEWDVSGEKLLGLFGEVIQLLPESLRGLVTFATYPDAMPSEGACLLRGSYAATDEVFMRSASSQAWIDCVGARVVNEDLLPAGQADWAMMLEEARRENVDLQAALQGLQASNALLDQECQRWKKACEKLEAEQSALKVEHEKLKCTLLKCMGKLRVTDASASPTPPPVTEVPRSKLNGVQLEKVPRPRTAFFSKSDVAFWWIFSVGIVTIICLLIGVAFMRRSLALERAALMQECARSVQVEEVTP